MGFTGMAQDTRLVHLLGVRLANSRKWPNWSKDSESRAHARRRGDALSRRLGGALRIDSLDKTPQVCSNIFYRPRQHAGT